MPHEYSAALILRRGFELASSFVNCPTGTKRALEFAAIHAETAEKMRRAVDNSTWAKEPHFMEGKRE